MQIEYTKSIEEIFRIPNKFPHPKDKDTLLKLKDRIEEEKAFDIIQVSAPTSEKCTYYAISKYPVITKNKPFIGSSSFFYYPEKESFVKNDYYYPSNAIFTIENIFSKKVESHLKKNVLEGKKPEIFILKTLQMLYGKKFIIGLLEKKYNIYADVVEKLKPVLLMMDEVFCDEQKFFNTNKEWLLKLSRNDPSSILNTKLNLKELIGLYMISSRCDDFGFDELRLEVVRDNDFFYAGMSGVDLVIKEHFGDFLITQVIYNNKKDCVKEFNELDYFFPLFNRSEIVGKMEFKKEVLKKTLGSFFFSSCFFEDENTVIKVEADEFFIEHATNAREFENIKIFNKNNRNELLDITKENKHLSNKDKSILNQLFYLVREEFVSIFKSMNLSLKSMNSDEFALFKMQFKNNEPLKLEKMFDRSLFLLNKMEARDINIKDINFDNEEWK